MTLKNEIERTLNESTTYRIAKETGLNDNTLQSYKVGKRSIGNMQVKTVDKLLKYDKAKRQLKK